MPMTLSPRAFLSGLALLALGAVLPQHAPAQQTAADSLRETYRDWIVQCQSSAQGPRVCEMMQQVDHEESGQRVMAFSLRPLPDNRLAVIAITPFGLRLADGMRVQVGDQIVAQFPYDTCLSEGCLVTGVADDALVTQMRTGISGGAVFITRSGEPFGVPLSLMGFSSALERLRELARN